MHLFFPCAEARGNSLSKPAAPWSVCDLVPHAAGHPVVAGHPVAELLQRGGVSLFT